MRNETHSGEKISVLIYADCCFVGRVPEKDSKCYMGIGSFASDGSAAVETFTNVNGYNGGKGYANEGWEDVNKEYFIRGGIVKNNVFYQIDIRCDWADKAEADRIFETWANNF